MLVDRELDVQKLALVIKRNQNIGILHGLKEIIEFTIFLVVFLFFFLGFLLALFFFDLLFLCVLQKEREVDLDIVLTFAVSTYEEVQRAWQRNEAILVLRLLEVLHVRLCYRGLCGNTLCGWASIGHYKIFMILSNLVCCCRQAILLLSALPSRGSLLHSLTATIEKGHNVATVCFCQTSEHLFDWI